MFREAQSTIAQSVGQFIATLAIGHRVQKPQSLYTPTKRGTRKGKTKNLQNMHPQQVLVQCTFVDEISLGIKRLGICTKSCVPLTSRIQINFEVQGRLIGEVRIALYLAQCFLEVAIQHLDPLSGYENVVMNVLNDGGKGQGVEASTFSTQEAPLPPSGVRCLGYYLVLVSAL